MRLPIIFVLGVCLKIIAVSASAAAFALSGAGSWVGGQIPLISGHPEYIGGGVAFFIMSVAVGLKWNATPLSRNLSPAVVGTILHIPGILSESATRWANVAPSPVAGLFTESAITESMLTTTFIVLIVTSVSGFIIDSSIEETSDLIRRGLDEDSVRTVVNQAVIIKVGTLLFALAFTIIAGPLLRLFGTVHTDSLPLAALRLGGVLAVIVPVAIYFESWTLRNAGDDNT